MTIEQWAIDKVKPYHRNARKIPEKAIAKVATSLAQFGWKQPLVVDPLGVIIVGHTRLLAAKKLGMAHAPVLVAKDLTPAQVKAYRLMDNRSHDETAWDLDLLGLEMSDLKMENIDLEFTGFDLPEIEDITKVVPFIDYPELPTGDKSPFGQMTFTLHESQIELVKEAIAAVGSLPVGVNANSNGNALARICEVFLEHHS